MPLRRAQMSRHDARAQALTPNVIAMPPDALASSHLHWRADDLWQQLEPYLPGLSVEVLARTDSTNSLLLERARVGGGRHDAPVSTPGELEASRRADIAVG